MASLHIAVSSLFTGFSDGFYILRAKTLKNFISYIFYIIIFNNFILKKYAINSLSILNTGVTGDLFCPKPNLFYPIQ